MWSVFTLDNCSGLGLVFKSGKHCDAISDARHEGLFDGQLTLRQYDMT